MGLSHSRLRSLCATVGAASAVVLAAGQPTALGQIEWRAGVHAPAPMDGASLQNAISALSATSSHGVAQFSRPVSGAERAALRDAGVSLLAPLGSNAYFVGVEAGARPLAAAQSAPLVSVEPVQLDWKWHPSLAAGQVPTWAVVRDQPGDPVVAVYVVYQRDVDAQGALMDAPAFGATIVDVLETINGAVLEIPFSRIAELAASDDVQWVEPALPAMSETNAENRAITQVNDVQAAPYDLDGTGVTALIYDGGRAFAHSDFSSRLTIVPGDTSGISDHSTHVAGTVGGDGTLNFNNRGMAPNVSLLSAGFEWAGGGIFLYTNPGDIEQDYGTAISMGADVANNSIGTNTETNGFPCAIQGDYGVTSSVIDAIVRGGLGDRITIVWANGNERQGSSCDIEGYGDFYSTAPPAGAKNHITVGALNANNDSMTSFSSWGPVDDGRMKPDVSAPGCQQGGDGGVTSTSSSNSYNVKCGTSMASPTVCGITALILQDFRAQFPGLEDPRASTMKVILAQTAHDLGNQGPDYQFGYGSVRAKDAVDFLRTAQFTEQEISQGAVHTFQVDVEAGTPELRYTLAWDDAPGTPNVDPALVNQLDMRLVDPQGGVHYPWVLDPFNPSAPATRDQANTRDNIEQVWVESPMAGEWTIEVEATSVPEGPQAYSLAGAPSLNVSLLAIGLPSGAPGLTPPNTPVDVQVTITTINETLVPGSEKLFYRFDGGSFSEVALSPDGDGYVATIPGTGCDTTPEFYVSAEGVENGVVYNPSQGPDGPLSYEIGEILVLASDDIEADSGWVAGVNGDTATTGQWERGNPVGTDAQPEDDHTPTPGTDCYFTGQGVQGGGLGDNDVDNGFTTLLSPVYDIADAPEAEISYWRWYSNNTGNAPNTDVFVIDVSNDGGSTWANVETVGPGGAGTSGGWIQHTFRVADIVPVSDQIRLRFIAEDDPSDGNGSLVEAAIDDLSIETFACESGCYADFNGDGSLDILDFVAFQGAFQAADPQADCNDDGALDILDFVCFQGAFGAGCP